MASSGLTTKDEKLLNERLQQLDLVLSRDFLLGKKDADLVRGVADRIRNRLDPDAVEKLDTDGTKLLEHLGWRRLPWVESKLGPLQ